MVKPKTRPTKPNLPLDNTQVRRITADILEKNSDLEFAIFIAGDTKGRLYTSIADRALPSKERLIQIVINFLLLSIPPEDIITGIESFFANPAVMQQLRQKYPQYFK